jgi:hypothetical protein
VGTAKSNPANKPKTNDDLDTFIFLPLSDILAEIGRKLDNLDEARLKFVVYRFDPNFERIFAQW